MKNYITILVLFLVFKGFSQNDAKAKFQKNKYEMAVACYKKADFKNALDLYSIASKIKPENELGKESIRKVDTLKAILRKDIMDKVFGNWKLRGDKPIWSVNSESDSKNALVQQFIEINKTQILFFEQDKKTLIKKLIKTENLVFYNKDESDSLFSAIILSDGTIWNCTVEGGDSDILHVINIAKQTEKGVEKIESNNLERFYTKG